MCSALGKLAMLIRKAVALSVGGIQGDSACVRTCDLYAKKLYTFNIHTFASTSIWCP